MKITKEQLKQIIKEELGGILKEMGPEFPGEELPQGSELGQSLKPVLDTDAPPTAVEKMEQWVLEHPEVWEDPNGSQILMLKWGEISSGHDVGRM